MFKLISFIVLMIIGGGISGQQINIDRVDMMPSIPEPYNMRDWKNVAHHYDSLVFNTTLSGQYLPVMAINENGLNYPNHESAAMVSYVGKTLGTSAEGINYLPAVIGATLSGINKSSQFGYNWVLMGEDFFNHRPAENVYLNNYAATSGHDWWYETMPNVFFYQLNALYPNTGDFNYQFEMVANRWLEAVGSMGGSVTPWEAPYMNYRAWNLNQMKPLIEGVKQPEAAGAIGWILYNAYCETGNRNYLIGAEWALEFLSNWDENPSYELQLPYGAYVAARMNAEIGTNYNINKIINWCFNRGSLRGWGCIVGKWGNYDCSGLFGEANDAGNDYAFVMNGFQQAAALVPLVRYNEHYANAIGKWVLNVANASRLFYPGFLPADQQDSEDWSLENDFNNCIAHEAMKELKNGKSPFATGDAINGGWASTNLALYGSSHVGYFGGIIATTNVDAVLKLDLCKTDFYSTSHPSFLIWNPYENDTTVTINVGSSEVDIYNSIENTFIKNDVSGTIDISIPAKNSVILVYVPNNAEIEYNGKKTLANNIVIDFDNGEIIADYPPRIKALKALKNPVTVDDSIKIFCTAEDIDNTDITYDWKIDGELVQGNEIFSIKAIEQPGFYEISCIVTSGTGLTDSMNIVIEVKERIPHIPEIILLKANPGKIDLGKSTTVSCLVYEQNGDEIVYNWFANQGTITGQGEAIQWLLPDAAGNYKIYCTVFDIDGESKDSVFVMVRELSNLQKGEPVLYLPFNGNVHDYSRYSQNTTSLNITYKNDAFDNPASAAQFNGTSSYVRVENTNRLNFALGLTLTGWIYSQHEGGNEAYPVSHGNWQNRWKVSISNNILRFTVKTNQGVKDLDTKTLIENENWYHFAMVYTGTDLEIYLDGQLDSFVPFTGEILTTTYDLVLGRARPDQAYFFKGRLDDIYLFDHPLSPTHIKNMYDTGVAINENRKSGKNINIFPNPAKQSLFVDFGQLTESKTNYQLIGILGKVVSSGTWLNNNNTQFCINTGNVQSGVYLLIMQMGEMCITHKLLILK